MSGSEIGVTVTTSSEPFTIGIQKPSQPPIQNMHLAYSADGTPVYKHVDESSPVYQSAAANVGGGSENSAGANMVPHHLSMNVSEPMKKKRGRPRKYGPDGSMASPLSSAPPAVAVAQPGGTFSPPPPAAGPGGGSASPSSFKKARGRPPGSANKKQQSEALGSGGVGFTPHVITVKAGEDVSSKIMSFSQNGPRAVCVLSANGAISNVTLRQAATSGGTATYEGRFDILSLSGSFLLSEVGGQRSRTGGLSVSLAGPDGRVLGGCVAGLLTAASPVQVIIGSFVADGRKDPKAVNQMEFFGAQPKFIPTGASSPPSHGTLSESSGGGPGSPLNQSTGGVYSNNNAQGIPMPTIPWK